MFAGRTYLVLNIIIWLLNIYTIFPFIRFVHSSSAYMAVNMLELLAQRLHPAVPAEVGFSLHSLQQLGSSFLKPRNEELVGHARVVQSHALCAGLFCFVQTGRDVRRSCGVSC